MFETSKTAQVTNEMEEYRIGILDIRESKRKNKNKTRAHKCRVHQIDEMRISDKLDSV